MTDLLVKKVISQSRSALEPTEEDRERVFKNVIVALGPLGGAGLIAAEAAKGATSSAGAVASTSSAQAGLVWKVLLPLAAVIGISTALFWENVSENTSSTDELINPASVTGGLTEHNAAEDKEIGKNKEIVQSSPPLPSSLDNAGIPVDNENISDPNQARGGGTSSPSTLPEPEAGKGHHENRVTSNSKPAPPSRTRKTQEKSPDEETTLIKEIALLKKASQSINQGKARQALSLLDDYNNEFPKGVLRQERNGLRVIALCALDDPRAALAEERFLTRAPNSPLSMRVRKQCAKEGKKSE